MPRKNVSQIYKKAVSLNDTAFSYVFLKLDSVYANLFFVSFGFEFNFTVDESV